MDNILLEMQRVKDLTQSERQIVNYILENPLGASTMGIAEIAEKSGTSASSVMRLCKKLQLKSFTSMRLALSSGLNEYLQTQALYDEHTVVDGTDTTQDVIRKICSNNATAILNFSSLNSEATVNKVVDMMGAAKAIDFYGSGVSNIICVDSLMKILRLGIPSTAYGYYGQMGVIAKSVNKQHLSFLISYSGMTKETLSVARILHLRGIPSISITSYTDNPLIEICDVNLFVDCLKSTFKFGGMSNRIAMVNVLDICVSAFISKNYDKFKDILQSSNAVDAFFNDKSYKSDLFDAAY